MFGNTVVCRIKCVRILLCTYDIYNRAVYLPKVSSCIHPGMDTGEHAYVHIMYTSFMYTGKPVFVR